MSFDQGHDSKEPVTESKVVSLFADLDAVTGEVEDAKALMEKIQITIKKVTAVEITLEEMKEYTPAIAVDLDGTLNVPDREETLLVQHEDYPIAIPNIPLSKLVFKILANEGRRVIAASLRVKSPLEHWQRSDMEVAFDMAYGEERNFLLRSDTEAVHQCYRKSLESLSDKERASSLYTGEKDILLQAINKHTGLPILFIDDDLSLGKEAELNGFDFIPVVRNEQDGYYEDYRFLFELVCRSFPNATWDNLRDKIRKHATPHEAAEVAARMQLENGVFQYLAEREEKLAVAQRWLADASVANESKFKACFALLRHFRALPTAQQKTTATQIHLFIKTQLIMLLTALLSSLEAYQKPWGLLVLEEHYKMNEHCNHSIVLTRLKQVAEGCGLRTGTEDALCLVVNTVLLLSQKTRDLFEESRRKFERLIEEYKQSTIAEKRAKISSLRVAFSQVSEELVIIHLQTYINKVPSPTDLSELFHQAYMTCPLLNVPGKGLLSLAQYTGMADRFIQVVPRVEHPTTALSPPASSEATTSVSTMPPAAVLP